MEPLIVSGGEKRKPVFAPYYKGGRRLHIGVVEFAEDFGGSVSKAALGSMSVMKMAAGYLGKAVAASKVEKQTDKAGIAADPAAAAASADEQEGRNRCCSCCCCCCCCHVLQLFTLAAIAERPHTRTRPNHSCCSSCLHDQ